MNAPDGSLGYRLDVDFSAGVLCRSDGSRNDVTHHRRELLGCGAGGFERSGHGASCELDDLTLDGSQLLQAKGNGLFDRVARVTERRRRSFDVPDGGRSRGGELRSHCLARFDGCALFCHLSFLRVDRVIVTAFQPARPPPKGGLS